MAYKLIFILPVNISFHISGSLTLRSFVVGITSGTIQQGQVIDPNSYTICYSYIGPVPDAYTVGVFCDTPVIGQTLIIQMPTTNKQLCLCEVEVYGGTYENYLYLKLRVLLKLLHRKYTVITQLLYYHPL